MQMMLFNYMCFEEMTAPPIFSVPWDKAPPATLTTPSVRTVVTTLHDSHSTRIGLYTGNCYHTRLRQRSIIICPIAIA